MTIVQTSRYMSRSLLHSRGVVAAAVILTFFCSLLHVEPSWSDKATELATNDHSVQISSQGYPAKTIKIMVPANPGGGWDQLARLMQNVLISQKISPVPVEVVNRGGAGGTVGLAVLVGRHNGDPYTLMIGGGVMTGAALAHQSPFKLGDTTPLARLVSEFEVVAVPYDSPYQTLQQLVADFRAHPETFTWGGGSAGGVDHMLVGLIAEAAGVAPGKINYVAFSSGGEAGAAVMGGQVSAGVSGLAEWEGLAEGKRLRMLGISSPLRIGNKKVPTLTESGLDIQLENWRCIVAPPGMHDEQRAWMIMMLETMRETEQWQTILERNSWSDSFLTGDAFTEFILQDEQATARMLSHLGIGEGGEGYAVVGPYVFPAIVGAGMGLTLIGLLIAHIRSSKTTIVTSNDAQSENVPNWYKMLIGASITLVYILLLQPLGVLLATPPFIVAQSRLMGSRKLLRDIVAGVILAILIYTVFKYFLHVDVS